MSQNANFFTGRAGLVVPGLLAAFATYLLIGQFTMDVPADVEQPGPRFYPMLLIIAMYTLAVIYAIMLIRTPEYVDTTAEVEPDTSGTADDVEKTSENSGSTYRWYTDWSRILWALVGCVVFMFLLFPVGWIISAALLFWCMTRALGSRKPLFDASLALLFSSVVYLTFGVLLGVNLPAGFFGGI